MSGRKDYSILFEIERQIKLAAELKARRAERAALTRKRLEDAKASSQNLVAEIQKERRAQTKSKLAAAKTHTKELLSKVDAETAPHAKVEVGKDLERAKQLMQSAQDLGVADSVLQGFTDDLLEFDVLDESKRSEILDSLKSTCEDQSDLNHKLEEQVALMFRWKENLLNSDEAQSFASSRCSEWNSEMELLLKELNGQSSNIDDLKKVESAILKAESIVNDSGDVSDKFHARNMVLSDIIESMKEIGFFVENPRYADAESPEDAVIIRASRGGQTMTAQIDLDMQVQSDWQGVHGAYCTDAFFEYVKAMGERGVDVTPENPDLFPRLLEKGEREIPPQEKRSLGEG